MCIFIHMCIHALKSLERSIILDKNTIYYRYNYYLLKISIFTFVHY